MFTLTHFQKAAGLALAAALVMACSAAAQAAPRGEK